MADEQQQGLRAMPCLDWADPTTQHRRLLRLVDYLLIQVSVSFKSHAAVLVLALVLTGAGTGNGNGTAVALALAWLVIAVRLHAHACDIQPRDSHHAAQRSTTRTWPPPPRSRPLPRAAPAPGLHRRSPPRKTTQVARFRPCQPMRRMPCRPSTR